MLPLIVTMCCSAWAQSATAESKSKLPSVTVPFFVLDGHGVPSSGFAKADLSVLDSNKREQWIEAIHLSKEMPLRLGALIDTSNSVAHNFAYAAAVQAVADFLKQILTNPEDRAFLVSFSALPQGTRFLTRDEVLSLKLDPPSGGGTALYDAVTLACMDRMKPDPAQPARRVLLLLSDGEDNLSHVNRSVAIAAAQATGTVVFALDPGGFTAHEAGKKTLEAITQETGGRVFSFGSSKDITKALAGLKEQIETIYGVTFAPSELATPGKPHAIELKDMTDGKLKIRAPKAYFDASQPSATAP